MTGMLWSSSMIDQIKNGINKVKADHTALLMKKLDLVPVIFANGEDDDVPGLKAAFDGQRVQYLNKVYDVTEDINLHGAFISMTADLHLVINGQRYSFMGSLMANYGNFVCICPTRKVEFFKCSIQNIAVARM